jgi:hypothetical protein
MTHDGRALRILVVIDEYTRECLAFRVARRLGSLQVIDRLVRDEHEHIIGRRSESFGTTRDEHGKLVSINTADAGLLIGEHNKK